MDVQKSLSQRAFNLNKSAQKEYNTHAAHSSQTQLDAETFRINCAKNGDQRFV